MDLFRVAALVEDLDVVASGVLIEGSGAESHGYSILDVGPDGTIAVTRSRKQKRYDWDGRE